MMLKYNIQKKAEYVDLRATIEMPHQGSTKSPIDIIEIDKNRPTRLTSPSLQEER